MALNVIRTSWNMICKTAVLVYVKADPGTRLKWLMEITGTETIPADIWTQYLAKRSISLEQYHYTNLLCMESDVTFWRSQL
jgi:hypothetical protein